MDTYDAQIVADSISPDGVRLTTMQVTCPRFILAEFNTHRDKSRNSASSRAIPTEQLIQRIVANPFVPETFNKRVKGMGVGEAFNEEEARFARSCWLAMRDYAVDGAEYLMGLNVDKSRANRLLEPFMWHTIVVTATEWSHFFGLRNHEGAQPEFRKLAAMMEELYAGSDPVKLEYGWWHLPYINEDELGRLCRAREDYERDQMHPMMFNEMLDRAKLVSVRRCARVSWDKAGESEPTQEAVDKALVLKSNGHTSPFEHVARPLDNNDLFDDRSYKLMVPFGLVSDWNRLANRTGNDMYDYVELDKFWCGNLRGWWQYRKDIPNENRFDLIARAAGSAGS